MKPAPVALVRGDQSLEGLSARMWNLKSIEDPEEQQRLWLEYQPQIGLFDLWEVRECFAAAYDRRSIFVTMERDGRIKAMLPLSWIEESACYGFFPGETWRGRTWLEQNRLIAESPAVLKQLLQLAPGPLQLRYIDGAEMLPEMAVEDECNFGCSPGQYGYSFNNYCKRFSAKTSARIATEFSSLEHHGIRVRLDEFDDLQILFELNLATFGKQSYFCDSRFLKAFDSLARWLAKERRLSIVSILVGGKVVAVDMVAIHNNCHLVLAGGASREIPGISRFINLYHLERGFLHRVERIDFLCGDFGWKKKLLLEPRPTWGIMR